MDNNSNTVTVHTDGGSVGLQCIDGEWFRIYQDGNTKRYEDRADALADAEADRQVAALLSNSGGGK